MGIPQQIRQVVVLAGAQSLFQIGAVMMATIGALAGAAVTPIPQLATLPNSSLLLGNLLVTVPASMWMERAGRRPGFLAGAGFGVAGGLLAAAGVALNSLWVLAVGTCLLGAYQAFAQYYRFAAAEAVDDRHRPRAISMVLGGGIVAALVGPNLARFGQELLGARYAGSFLLVALVATVAIGVLLQLRLPPPARVNQDGPARPLIRIVRQPRYIVAMFSAATAYGVMILAMTAAPLAMVNLNHEVSSAAFVIQMHVLGMFLPSFFTGSLIMRFGVLPVMGTGVACLSAHVFFALSGTAVPDFASALIFLGVGWNFLYVGGTTLLTGTYTPAERGKAQAANDMLVLVIGLSSSLGSGALLQIAGWHTMNTYLIPWLGLAALAIAALAIGERRRIAPVTSPA